MRDVSSWQGARYQPGLSTGHYESWFLRANHPVRKQAFWIRYTIFSPKDHPEKTIGELWAVYSDGETGRIHAAKSEVPVRDCSFSAGTLAVKIGNAFLQPGVLQGEARGPQKICWNLTYDGGGAPLVFLPENLYSTALPKAKAVTPRPFVRFAGSLDINGETVDVTDWIGSENHNWGSKHTDTYAWGQVAGFDNAPDAFLEAATAKLKVGPLWTPPLTVMVLRVGDEEYRLNTLARSFLAKGRWHYFDWTFAAAHEGVRITGRMHAAREDFVGLTYYNPPGGSHTCLNSKVAACEIRLERKNRPVFTLRTAHRAAFEILTDDQDHGVPVVA
ncbi:MAG: hypothetical protein PSX71_10130 [bacterium]|nr:hypothetical protein [bacterium]